MPTLQKKSLPATPVSEPQQVARYITHTAKIKPNSVVVYKRYHGFSTQKSEAELQNLEKGKSGEYNGFMSPATARKVRTMLENWLLTLERNITDNWRIDTATAMADSKGHEYYPTFVTLTLPAQQFHDDNYIKRELLNRFIITLKTRYNVGHYFWRAEPQKNSSIHFHILCDKWIHWKAIRYEWNKILDDHGYIESYRKNQKVRHRDGFNPDVRQMRHQLDRIREQRRVAGQKFDPKSEQKRILQRNREAWEEGVKNNWSDPNSTDIHAIEKVDNLTGYVVKYVTKTDGAEETRGISEDGETEIITTKSRKIIGRIWGCSDGIRNLKHFEQEVATEVDYHAHTLDTPAYEFVRHLEKEAKARQEADPDDESIWRDEDSGTTVYRLDQKSYMIIRSLFPQLFEQYAQHYATAYTTLYGGSERSEKYSSIMPLLPDSTDIGGIDEHFSLGNYAKSYPSFGPVIDYCPF